jgi:hypothetical protein
MPSEKLRALEKRGGRRPVPINLKSTGVDIVMREDLAKRSWGR